MKTCRCCNSSLSRIFVDLGEHPSANRLLTKKQLDQPVPTYPLKVFVCEQCFLVQIIEANKASDIFVDDYVYYSSYSKSWEEHARQYVHTMIQRFGFDDQSNVVEVASNDGYLLQFFVKAGVPCLGIDPASNTAKVAAEKGVETLVQFFSAELARELVRDRGCVDLVCGNNVFAHVPEVNDFVEGLCILLKSDGILTLEFPHLAKLIERVQFDTIYDEHFSYFSLAVTIKLMRKHGLEVFDVEELPTHGGSLRVFARRAECTKYAVLPSVAEVLNRETDMGLDRIEGYTGFQGRVEKIRDEFLAFIAKGEAENAKIIGYGAAAKGNTFLNYCDVGADVMDFVVDDTPAKQGKFLPKSGIPVYSEESIRQTQPDFIVILPWNVQSEIASKLAYVREWGCQFVTCIPNVRIF